MNTIGAIVEKWKMLKPARERARLTQQKIADAADVDKSTIWRYEKGQIPKGGYNAHVLRAYRDLTGLDVSGFLSDLPPTSQVREPAPVYNSGHVPPNSQNKSTLPNDIHDNRYVQFQPTTIKRNGDVQLVKAKRDPHLSVYRARLAQMGAMDRSNSIEMLVPSDMMAPHYNAGDPVLILKAEHMGGLMPGVHLLASLVTGDQWFGAVTAMGDGGLRIEFANPMYSAVTITPEERTKVRIIGRVMCQLSFRGAFEKAMEATP